MSDAVNTSEVNSTRKTRAPLGNQASANKSAKQSIKHAKKPSSSEESNSTEKTTDNTENTTNSEYEARLRPSMGSESDPYQSVRQVWPD